MNGLYSRQMDELDASVFSGELLYLNLNEFKDYLARWQRAVIEQESIVKDADVPV